MSNFNPSHFSNETLSFCSLDDLNAEIVRAEAELARWQAMLLETPPTCGSFVPKAKQVAEEARYVAELHSQWNEILIEEEGV